MIRSLSPIFNNCFLFTLLIVIVATFEILVEPQLLRMFGKQNQHLDSAKQEGCRRVERAARWISRNVKIKMRSCKYVINMGITTAHMECGITNHTRMLSWSEYEYDIWQSTRCRAEPSMSMTYDKVQDAELSMSMTDDKVQDVELSRARVWQMTSQDSGPTCTICM